MFRKSQRFYDAIYGWKDYPAEAEKLHRLIQARVPGARTLLDVACGTGKHLELLRGRYDVEGIDIDPGMLEVARERLGGGVPLHEGDMTSFDLGRTFDVVTCLFSAIAYARITERLGAAVTTMEDHVRPGGLVVVEPFFSPDEWTPGFLDADLVDEPDLKVARMSRSATPENEQVTMTFHYLVATPDGVEHFTEDHVAGMFTDADYREAFESASLEIEHDAEGLMGRGLYIGTKPA